VQGQTTPQIFCSKSARLRREERGKLWGPRIFEAAGCHEQDNYVEKEAATYLTRLLFGLGEGPKTRPCGQEHRCGGQPGNVSTRPVSRGWSERGGGGTVEMETAGNTGVGRNSFLLPKVRTYPFLGQRGSRGGRLKIHRGEEGPKEGPPDPPKLRSGLGGWASYPRIFWQREPPPR